MLSLVAIPNGSSAAEIAVQSSKVYEGGHAATLTLGSVCTGERQADVTGRIENGHFVACTTLVADAEVSGDATFESGKGIVLRPGFRVGRGASFKVRRTPPLDPDISLLDLSPASEQVYAARWWLNTDDFRPNASTRFDHLAAFDSAGELEFRVIVRQSRHSELVVEVVEDDGGRVASTGTPLELPANGWHSIQIVWIRSSGADDGSARLCVDQSACAAVTDLDNDTGSIDAVHWGSRGFEGANAGALHLDDIRSFRDPELLDRDRRRSPSG